MVRRDWRGLVVVAAVCWLSASGRASTADVYQSSAIGLAHQLNRLGTTARVLHIAAHPDDEDTALLTALSRGNGARVAYLSLNRGEGGQNGIGPEVHDALGLVRTAELLAARSIDGAEQYFAGVYDFGFTKTLEEAATRWGHDATLEDVVWVIRKFRPHVIIPRFTGTSADGHGQHQFVGQLAREAFRAAADPKRFPAHAELGLPPWRAMRLYQDRFRSTEPGYALSVGEWSPLYGRSWLSIAMESRSQHRSQDMGRAQPYGPSVARLGLLDSTVPTDPDLGPLHGLPLGLTELLPPQVADEPAATVEIRSGLAAAAAGIEQANALQRDRAIRLQSIAGIAAALRALRRVDDAVEAGGLPLGVDPASFRLALHQKLTEASEALAMATGIQLDAQAEQPQVVPGERLRIACEIFWPESAPVSGVRATLEVPDGWSVTAGNDRPVTGNAAPNAFMGYTISVPADAPPDQPYWLREPRQGDRYQPAPPPLRGLPLAPPRLACKLRCVVDGAVLQIVRPVTFREVDPRDGERRLPVLMPPPVSAEVEPRMVLLPGGRARKVELAIGLRNHASEPVAGTVAVRLGEQVLVELPTGVGAGKRELLRLPCDIPPLPERAELAIYWTPDGGTAQPLDVLHKVAYEHLPPHLFHTPATVAVVPVDVQVDTTRKLGYIPGPGDDLPEALARLGLSVNVLDDASLAEPTAFDGLETIFVGPRAYEVNEALQRANPRLLDWARAGGTLVVMYQKYPFVNGNYAPYRISMATPHDRIVDETAPVKVLAAEHSLLTTPNPIGPADFEGWVQERGLYFAHVWDAAYTPLLSAADPGEGAKDGGFLAADLGQGKYAYCAWALFRQLPEGVPGAYRLLANLAAW